MLTLFSVQTALLPVRSAKCSSHAERLLSICTQSRREKKKRIPGSMVLPPDEVFLSRELGTEKMRIIPKVHRNDDDTCRPNPTQRTSTSSCLLHVSARLRGSPRPLVQLCKICLALRGDLRFPQHELLTASFSNGLQGSSASQ